MSDRIIEDSLTRTRKLREEMKKRYDLLVAINAPQIIIDNAKSRLNITYAEYLLEQKEIKEEVKRNKTQYAKDNPLKKEIVDEIYSRMEKLPYSYDNVIDYHSFEMNIHVMTIMSLSDLGNDLYANFLNHAHELYYQKHKEQFEKDHENYKEKCASDDRSVTK